MGGSVRSAYGRPPATLGWKGTTWTRRSARWVEETAGGPITDVTRPASGGSRELYFVDVAGPDGTVLPLVVRCEGGGSFAGTEISPAKEAVVYSAVETPRYQYRASWASLPGAARVAGTGTGIGDLSAVDEPERAETMRSFIDAWRRCTTSTWTRSRSTVSRALETPKTTPVSISRCGTAGRRRRGAPRSAGALRGRVAARARAGRRDSHRAGAGRHGSGQLRVREREGHGHRRLGVRARRRPDGRLGVARHADARRRPHRAPGSVLAATGSQSTTSGSATTAPRSTTGAP